MEGMSTRIHPLSLGIGLFAGVALVFAVKRVRDRHARAIEARAQVAERHFIDGTRKPEAIEIAAHEATSTAPLMSEAADMEPKSQRW